LLRTCCIENKNDVFGKNCNAAHLTKIQGDQMILEKNPPKMTTNLFCPNKYKTFSLKKQQIKKFKLCTYVIFNALRSDRPNGENSHNLVTLSSLPKKPFDKKFLIKIFYKFY
jgi:hypothetical protein